MGGAESVVHVRVGVCRQRDRERRLVGLLPAMEPEVLEQEDFPGRRRPTASNTWSPMQSLVTNTGLPEEALQPLGDGPHPEMVDDHPVGTAKVAGQHDAGAWRTSNLIVGSAARMRVSSVIKPWSRTSR